MKEKDFIVIITTCDSRDVLIKLAQGLVEKKLAACVQIVGPITSTYRWQGKVESADEWLCQIKTLNYLYQEVEREIISLHPYETPEIIALPVTLGSEPYLDWIKESVKPD